MYLVPTFFVQLLYTNYKNVVSDYYCHTHHTTRERLRGEPFLETSINSN